MQEVTKEEFYKYIGHLDVVLTVKTNKKPYDVDFKLRNGTLKGTVKEDFLKKGQHPTVKKYLIKKLKT